MELRDIVTEDIRAHADITFPEECCGLVLSDGSTVRFDNESPTPRHSFKMDPARLLTFLPRAEFLYHSHPNRPAKASQADIASCDEVRLPYLIMSIPSGETCRQLPEGMEVQLLGRTFVYGVSDCFSLVHDFYQQKLDVMLPEVVRPAFGWWKSGEINAIEEAYPDAGFTEVESPQFGDILLMQAGGCKVIDHMAVYIGDQHIMHHTLMGLSRISPWDGYWNMITTKVIRHASQ